MDNALEPHQIQLRSEQVQTYRYRGFLHPVDLLSAEEVEVLRESLARMTEPDYPHGSYLSGTRGGKTPVVLVLNFMKPDTRSATAKPIMQGADPVPPGEIIAGDYFPIVWPLQNGK